MRLVDTSAWIEFLIGSPLGRRLAKEMPQTDEWLVPTIVQHELAKWLVRELDEQDADRVLALSKTCVVAELDTKTALAAADYCLHYKLATADAIIYATANAYGADLLTCDRHFERLPNVAYFPNAKA